MRAGFRVTVGRFKKYFEGHREKMIYLSSEFTNAAKFRFQKNRNQLFRFWQMSIVFQQNAVIILYSLKAVRPGVYDRFAAAQS